MHAIVCTDISFAIDWDACRAGRLRLRQAPSHWSFMIWRVSYQRYWQARSSPPAKRSPTSYGVTQARLHVLP